MYRARARGLVVVVGVLERLAVVVNRMIYTRKHQFHPFEQTISSLTLVVWGVVRKLLISLIALITLSIDPRGIPAMRETN